MVIVVLRSLPSWLLFLILRKRRLKIKVEPALDRASLLEVSILSPLLIRSAAKIQLMVAEGEKKVLRSSISPGSGVPLFHIVVILI